MDNKEVFVIKAAILKSKIKKGEKTVDQLPLSDLEMLLDYETDLILSENADMELINKCSEALGVLVADELKTEKETLDIIKSNKTHLVVEKAKPLKKTRKLPKRILIVAAVLSSLMTALTVSADQSQVPKSNYRHFAPLDYEEKVETIISMCDTPPGTTVDYGNVTFYHVPENSKFDSYQEYLDAGGQPIYLPSHFTDGTTDIYMRTRQREVCGKTTQTVSAYIGDIYTNITAYLDSEMPESYREHYEAGDAHYSYVVYNGIGYYLQYSEPDSFFQDTHYVACCQIGNDFYSLQSMSTEKLELMIKNLQEGLK